MPEIAKELQEKFVLYQFLNQRLEEIKQHATIIQHRMMEIETSKIALTEMKTAKSESEILVPLGSGIYAFGRNSSSQKVLVDLGAGIIAKKTIDEATDFMEKKKKEIEDAVQILQSEANAITSKLQEIVPELQQAAQEQQTAAG